MEDTLLEHYPIELVESLERRNAWRHVVAEQNSDLSFLISDVVRWVPGSTVTVAFLDGSDVLHRAIADATRPIVEACNVTLDFGFEPSTGTFRRWTTTDTTHAADIRVSFDLNGYWSLVGTDAIDPAVGAAHGASGGRPHQRSLNLGGFDIALPVTWRRSVLREFLHALAFRHAHRNMGPECNDEFRWEDDPGYIRTQVNGGFVADDDGRRPGIYTYLEGAPNRWDQRKVDEYLRPGATNDAPAERFDPASVMLYRFPALFYRTNPSPCAPIGSGESLSAGDRLGLQLLYPAATEDDVASTTSAEVARQFLLEAHNERLASDAYRAATSSLLDRLCRRRPSSN